MRFFTGLHQPSDAKHFDAAFISVNRLRQRKSPMTAGDWIMDSGAFTEISTHGHYRHNVAEYAAEIRRWATNGSGRLLAASAQDWMCEDVVLKRAAIAEGTLAAPPCFDHASPHSFRKLAKWPWAYEGQGARQLDLHQLRTIDRFDELRAEDTAGAYILPVLQGFAPGDYVRHLEMYGDRLTPGMWVGVGSVCKRNGKPEQVAAVLLAIKEARPDLRLHGFGLKTTALAHPLVRSLLETADSMAWSFNARKNGRNANDWREAVRWVGAITARPVQHLLWRALALLGAKETDRNTPGRGTRHVLKAEPSGADATDCDAHATTARASALWAQAQPPTRPHWAAA